MREGFEVWQILTVLVGGIATIAIYSFLLGENRFYRFFEHLFVGMAAGFLPIFSLRYTLWPNVIEPLLGSDYFLFPDGTTSAEYHWTRLLYIAPMIFGLLYYFIFSNRYGWLAKLVIGFSLGAGAGLSFQGFFSEIVPQLASSLRPLIVFSGEQASFDVLESFNNIFFTVTLLSVLTYFFFSFQFAGGGLAEKSFNKIKTAGRLLMMICFGAFFGSTVMARLALLTERLQFLIYDFRGTLGWVIDFLIYSSFGMR
ncbi:MAG TPA: hypothetical protein PKD37_04555 [Oligoflexia bacterium]|nr:hypothetical protein [Oligoflexia bacterium]HMP27235.1 hypothetical protein [Oligoflexia bacterium]